MPAVSLSYVVIMSPYFLLGLPDASISTPVNLFSPTYIVLVMLLALHKNALLSC